MGREPRSPRVELVLGAPAGGDAGAPRGVVGGLIQWPWKLLLGDVPMGGWQGPRFPNASTDTHCFDSLSALASKEPIPCAPACLCIAHCGDAGCLFNLDTDEVRARARVRVNGSTFESRARSVTHRRGRSRCARCAVRVQGEHTDVAAQQPAIARRLLARARALNSSAGPPARGGLYNPDRGVRQASACTQAQETNGGFWGPFMS